MNFNNQLEPGQLIDFFRKEPPIGFTSQDISIENQVVPAFSAKYDLLITADKIVKKILRPVSFLLPKPKTLFVGTTVSEYSLYPAGINPSVIPDALLESFKSKDMSLLVVKDMSRNSPILSAAENAFSDSLISSFEKSRYMILQGEALAYVPICFSSIEEFMQKFSKSRKKDFKRKLKALSEITIEPVKTGDEFYTEAVIDELYGLYVKVYHDSDVHFDLLSRDFFSNVFRDPSCNGISFIYRRHERIIGFNLCFIVRGYLVDKYIGLSYPESYEYNLYFVSWFYNLEYCIKNNLSHYVAGWTDPEIKSYLGADFTYTYHAIYVKNPVLRFLLRRFKRFFEADKAAVESLKH